MRDHLQAEAVIQVILAWAKTQPEIRAVALVGSYARGTAGAGSDIDLIVLATAPDRFRADVVWPDAIDWIAIGIRPVKWQDEDYGRVWSRRLWLERSHGEVEISFAPLSWADVTPVDPGTRQVVAGGCRALHDPEGLLARLCAAINGKRDSHDPKRLVAAGYDRIGDAYLRRFGYSAVRERKLNELIVDLPPSAHVLDLGCGAGSPVARDLIERGFRVTGVDGSSRQLAQARRNVPAAEFIQADMVSVEFPACAFEAVSAFYSISHVPRDEHAALLQRIAGWLAPGGRFLASFGATALDDWTGEWLGTTMFFSHHSADVARQLVLDAGLLLQRTELLQQDNEDAQFLWVAARKP